MKLLLAEDTSDLNRAITAILQHEHYEVTSVLNGTDALKSILETPYDGIILDIMMPGLSGLEVLSELRAFPDSKSSVNCARTGSQLRCFCSRQKPRWMTVSPALMPGRTII